jgi:hypothetical protein
VASSQAASEGAGPTRSQKREQRLAAAYALVRALYRELGIDGAREAAKRSEQLFTDQTERMSYMAGFVGEVRRQQTRAKELIAG